MYSILSHRIYPDEVSECPTLVIGIGMVRGMGFGADTVVCANSCLDSQCMRFASAAYLQKKADLVDKYTMRDIYEVRKSILFAPCKPNHLSASCFKK